VLFTATEARDLQPEPKLRVANDGRSSALGPTFDRKTKAVPRTDPPSVFRANVTRLSRSSSRGGHGAGTSAGQPGIDTPLCANHGDRDLEGDTFPSSAHSLRVRPRSESL
jgi:hypothetical protein